MSQRLALLSATCATSVLALVGSALAQYTTGFETSNGINASPGGTVLTGQDGFYVPSGIDYWAMTYAGNAFGIAANPQGGAQFAVGQGQGSPNFSRGQRDITWPAPLATMQYDVACLYTGAPPASNNLGSFSIQPYPGSASAIHLFSFPDLNNPTVYQAGYLAYNADGSVMVGAGTIPGPEWSSLSTNHWYRFQTKVDFTTNQMVEASLTDLTTQQTTTATLTGVYLEGGSAGGRPAPTGFRMFSGGGLAGNVVAFDNLSVTATSGGACNDFAITQGGSCPGPMTISWTGAPVGVTKRVIYTSSGGSGGVIPPGNPCAGTTICIGLAGVTLHPASLPGTASGTSPNFNAPCGLRVQLIGQGSCETSNALVLQ
jgi:hypothetical protein